MASIPSGSTSNGESVFDGRKERRKMSKSATITESEARLANPTPGDVLMEDFLRPIGMSQSALAGAIGVSPRRVNELSLIHISEPTRQAEISYAVFCLKKKK